MGWSANDSIALGTVAQATILTAAAFFARKQVKEAQQLRSDQARPYVVVYVELSSVARTLVDLVVENTGRTAAKNVVIEFTPHLESTMASKGEDRVYGWVALKEGIPYLAPGQRMTHLLDNLLSRYAENCKLPRRYDVVIRYGDDLHPKRNAHTEEHCEKHVLDLDVWKGSHYVQQEGVHDISKSLGEIAKTIRGWTHTDGGVTVYSADLEKHQDKRDKMINELIAKNQASRAE